jgi:hypothetical protein
VWRLVLRREETKVLTLGPSEPRSWPIKPRWRTSTPVWTKNRRRYVTEAPEWGNAEDDFDPLPRFPRRHKVSATPPPAAAGVAGKEERQPQDRPGHLGPCQYQHDAWRLQPRAGGYEGRGRCGYGQHLFLSRLVYG